MSIDDVLIWRQTVEEHNTRLKTALDLTRDNGLKRNTDKWQFRKTQITFLGDKLTCEGVQIDESKVTAIKNMPPPTDQEGVQRFLDVVNDVGKCVTSLSTPTSQMRSVLCKTTDWCWNSNQQKELEQLKALIMYDPVLRFCDAQRQHLSRCL